MNTEIKYRTFKELLDSVKLSLKTYDIENMIDAQQLIRVAMLINRQLGFKVNPNRTKALELNKGKAKLPYDFDTANNVYVCGGKEKVYEPGYDRTYVEGMIDAINAYQKIDEYSRINQYTEFKTLSYGANTITHNLITENILVQAFATDGSMLSFEINIVDKYSVVINSLSTTPVPDVKIVIMGAKNSVIIDDPAAEVFNVIGEGTKSYYKIGNTRYNLTDIRPLRLNNAKSVSADCYDLNSKNPENAYIKNGFIVTNYETGTILLNYQSLMEDEEGNLLIMYHEFVDDYYEYALKEKIYEDLFLNGEQVESKLQYVSTLKREAKKQALSFINTPDFNYMRKLWETNRKAMYHKYYNMFKN